MRRGAVLNEEISAIDLDGTFQQGEKILMVVAAPVHQAAVHLLDLARGGSVCYDHVLETG